MTFTLATSSRKLLQKAGNPEKRAPLFLRSDLALEERILKNKQKSAEKYLILRSVLTAQDRISKIRVLALSLGNAASSVDC